MTTARKLMLLLLGLDCVAVFLVFNAVSRLRGITMESHEIIAAPLLVPLILLLFTLYLIDGYKPRTDMMSLDYTSQHVIAIAFGMVATVLFTFVVLPAGYTLQSSRIVVSLSFILLAPTTLAYRRIIHGRLARRHDERSLVFLRRSRELFRLPRGMYSSRYEAAARLHGCQRRIGRSIQHLTRHPAASLPRSNQRGAAGRIQRRSHHPP